MVNQKWNSQPVIYWFTHVYCINIYIYIYIFVKYTYLFAKWWEIYNVPSFLRTLIFSRTGDVSNAWSEGCNQNLGTYWDGIMVVYTFLGNHGKPIKPSIYRVVVQSNLQNKQSLDVGVESLHLNLDVLKKWYAKMVNLVLLNKSLKWPFKVSLSIYRKVIMYISYIIYI